MCVSEEAFQEILPLLKPEAVSHPISGRARQKFLALAEFSPDMICEVDLKGNILYINHFYRDVQPEEIKGNSITSFVSDAGHDKLIEGIQTVVNDQTSVEIELRAKGAAGEMDWFAFHLMPVNGTSGDLTVLMVNRDVSHAKAIEKSLGETSKNYEYLFEHANDSIMITDPESHLIIQANQIAADRLDYTLEEFIGMTTGEITSKRGHEELKNIRVDLDESESMIFETYHLTRHGKEIPVEVSSRMIDYRGKRAFLNFVRDITARKRAEELLVRKNEELNSFIYRASHDLRGPIASIQGLVTVFNLEVEHPKAKEYFDMVMRCAEKLDRHLTDLLEITSMRNYGLNNSEIDWQSSIELALSEVAEVVGIEDVEITIENNFEGKYLADPKLIDLILTNFISNAVKYSRGLDRKPAVKVQVAEEPGGVSLTIKDNGIGIEKENQEKIFDMFYRDNHEAAGRGLGLYVIKMAVEKLKGRIRVESVTNEGSTFMIYLPSAEEGD